MNKRRQELLHNLLYRGVEKIYPSRAALRRALVGKRKLRIYLGIDPTAPSLHIGHVIQLQKLRQFQQLGHQVILLIGDFTGMIGDPTDKTAARKRLSHEEVVRNARDYQQQAGAILDFKSKKNPALIKYNSHWLGKLSFAEVIELAAEVTVQQMLQRSMFQERLRAKRPIWLHEFLYPLMQGYDSVAMEVDVEIGGSDQIFNMLVGSELVKRHLKKQKYVVANRLLSNPRGEKWGKTSGHQNIVWLKDTPLAMYQKIMLWPDTMVSEAFQLCTWVPQAEIKTMSQRWQNQPLEFKKALAREIVSELKGAQAAKEAEEAFLKKEIKETLEVKRNEVSDIPHLLVKIGLSKSVKAGRRLLAQGGVRLNGQVVKDLALPDQRQFTIQVGKKLTNKRRLLLR